MVEYEAMMAGSVKSSRQPTFDPFLHSHPNIMVIVDTLRTSVPALMTRSRYQKVTEHSVVALVLVFVFTSPILDSVVRSQIGAR